MNTKPHELIDEPCLCLHCKQNTQAIIVEAAYRLNREFMTNVGNKLASRIKGEWGNWRFN